MQGIYKITNKVNGKVYIGQSINIEQRWKQEIKGDCNKHLQNAFKKYGVDNFNFEVLVKTPYEECLDLLEIFAITAYESTDSEKGYNKCFGGIGNRGHHVTEVTKKKMSESHLGQSIPESQRIKMSKSSGGRNIICVETNEVHYQGEWRRLGYNHADEVASGKRKHCKGLHFKFIEGEN